MKMLKIKALSNTDKVANQDHTAEGQTGSDEAMELRNITKTWKLPGKVRKYEPCLTVLFDT